MFKFGLKKSQVGVTMALLVLGISICRHSGYPHVEENEDPTAAKDNVDNEEEQELFLDEDEYLEEEQTRTVLEEAADAEDGPTTKPDDCGTVRAFCDPNKSWAKTCCAQFACQMDAGQLSCLPP